MSRQERGVSVEFHVREVSEQILKRDNWINDERQDEFIGKVQANENARREPCIPCWMRRRHESVIPAPVIEPPAAPSCTVQVTAWFAPGGLTVAVNCWKAFIATLALDGETLTAAGDDGGGSGG